MGVDLEGKKTIHLQATTKIHGIVVPAWFAVMVGALFLAALFIIGLMYQRVGEMRIDILSRDKIIEREYRIFQQHLIDVENVLVRQGVATREDLTPWATPAAPTKEGE